MKASLDTNVIIHMYRAGKQEFLFQLFEEIYVYEQIIDVELKHHGEDIVPLVLGDIDSGRIKKIDDAFLQNHSVLGLFREYVHDYAILFQPQDLGEVNAISLARVLEISAIVTDDIKIGGPYRSLLEFVDYFVRPLTFTEVLLILFIGGYLDTDETIDAFYHINTMSNLNWSFQSKIREFVQRFNTDPLQEDDRLWMRGYCTDHDVSFKERISKLLKGL